ncbi:hypothetical protein HanRHA438_Chr05g0241281 [Helianthus annuus]|nr:hypothetical protein HanHA89_Chr05g0204811 [Helianthus annuus]KAJ0920435.1 hypothetical protein HanRHA438_Chr05g0241281 [Helianthus annuus]
MEPIKCNHFLNHSCLLDHAENKSRPFKLLFLTANIAVHSSFIVSTFFCPCSPQIMFSNLVHVLIVPNSFKLPKTTVLLLFL